MSRSFIHHVHIADGFVDDCEDLIHCWLKTDLTYSTFCELWKDKKFSFLYHGRTSGAEMIELSEELIQIAKHYMVSNTSNFEEVVAGLFIVYALVNLQPYKGFASLRIVPEDVPAIHRIEAVARSQKRYDVLYILGSLLTEGPVQYHAAAREHGMEPGIKKYLDGFTGIDRYGIRPRGVFRRQNEELDLLRELASISRRYADAKKAVAGVNNRDLNYASATFATDLDASLKKIISGIDETKEESTEKVTSMQSVRDKAMKQTVDGVRHLRSSAAKTKSPEKPRRKKQCEIKQKPGKIKQISPKKPVTTLARKKVSGVLPKRKRKRKISTSSSSNDGVPSSGKSDISETDKNNEEQDLNLVEFSKEKEVITEPNADSNNDNQNEVVPALVNISIDTLPVFIREEHNGKIIEIEIIDRLKPNVKDEHSKNDGKEKEEANSLKTTCISVASTSLERENQEADENIKKVLIKPEKKEQKRPILKSKLKRLGMLKVADLKEVNNTKTKPKAQKKNS